MREVGRIDNELDARLFADFLYNQGIEAEVEASKSGEWSVWVLDDDRLAEADQWLARFRADPTERQFVDGAHGAEAKRERREKEEQAYRKSLRSREQVFSAFNILHAGGVTLALIVACVVVFVAMGIGDERIVVRSLSISGWSEGVGGIITYDGHLKEIRQGQVWRLVTPVLLHFGIIHLLFNMMWLRDLGGMMEQLKGWRMLVGFVLVTAAFSNLAQYAFSGPGFGGMSGVVYALLGYVWMQSRFNPWSGFVLHPVTVQMMLIWFVLCLSGLVGNIANAAHGAGLVIGVVWGYVAARRGG